MFTRSLSGFVVALVFSTNALAQTLPQVAQTANLSGPRFGVTMLSQDIVDRLALRGIRLDTSITQFGWQWERQFFTKDSGVTMVTEFVGLLGGLEQNIVIPSLNWLVGMRTKEGAEFGLGPNLSPSGVAIVFAAGVTFRTRAFNVPLNIAYVPSRSGSRVSILTGFSLRR